jgi:hypothetical protein
MESVGLDAIDYRIVRRPKLLLALVRAPAQDERSLRRHRTRSDPYPRAEPQRWLQGASRPRLPLVGGKPAALLHLQSLLLVWDTVRRGRRASCGSGSGSPSTSPGRCSSTPRSTVGTTSSSSPRRPGKAGTPSGGRAGRPTIRMCAPAQVFGVTPYLLGGSCVRASLRPRPARPRESVRSLCAP